MKLRLPLITLGALALSTVESTAAPQVPASVLRTGEPIPGISTHNFTGVNWLGTNHSGGLIANIAGNDNGSFSTFLWGSVGGGVLGELQRPGPIGPNIVTDFTRACSGAGTSLAFLARVMGAPDAVFANEILVASVGAATGPGGGAWISFDEPFLDTAGRAWFLGRYTASPNSRVGLFRGTSLDPILTAGDSIAGMPGVVNDGGGPQSGYDVSRDGSHWTGVITSSTNVRALVRDGEVLAAGGVPLLSGQVLPPAFQLFPNETYNAFGQTQVTDGDRWAVIGGTPTGFIIRDGDLFVRPGDVVDGQILIDGFRAIAMNQSGGLAWVGRLSGGGGQQPYAVFRERTLLYKVGDDIDVDGDGLVDPGFTITDIPGSAGRLAYTEDGKVWAVVRITTPMGGSPFAVIGVGEAFGTSYCSSVPNSSGRGARMQATGSPLVADNALRVRCVDLPVNTFGLLLCSRTQGFTMGAGGSQGDLCLGGAIGRFNGQVVNSGPTASFDLPVDLTAMPQPNGNVAGMVGDAWNFQFWFRDTNPGVTSNFSDGVEVMLH